MKSIKRVLAVLLIVATILTLSTAALAKGKTFYVNADSVYFRKGPGLNYGIIRTLHRDDEIKATDYDWDERDVIWYEAKVSGEYGWVSSKYLSETPSSKKRIVLTGNKVHLRKDPDLNGKVLKTLDGGMVLTFTRTSKDDRGVIWFRVDYGDLTGWVSGKYAKVKK